MEFDRHVQDGLGDVDYEEINLSSADKKAVEDAEEVAATIED